MLEHGEIATAPLRSATQTDYLVLSGNGTRTWEPTFTYHGFRYVQVDNWPTEQTPLDRGSVKAIVVHSDMQRTGDFETSNSLLNKLTQNILWSRKFCLSHCIYHAVAPLCDDNYTSISGLAAIAQTTVII